MPNYTGIARSFTASDIEQIIGGARALPGFTREKVSDVRRRLGLGARDAPPTDAALAMIRQMAAWDWCPHGWIEQSPVALPLTDTIHASLFVSAQSRLCPRCGCTESRMWTADGYASLWLRPQLPVRRKVTP